MHCTIVYSPVVLRDLPPLDNYTLWYIFSKACSLLCRPYISEKEVDRADELLHSFCCGFLKMIRTRSMHIQFTHALSP